MDLRKVVKGNLCIGCGICTIDDKVGKLKVINRQNNSQVPANTTKDQDSLAIKVCPGKGYNIVSEGRTLYGTGKYNINLGFYYNLHAAHTPSKEILHNASSGGAITAILIYLLRQHIVDKVSVTQFYCDKDGVHTKSFLTNDRAEILKAQGSKYCPVDLSNLLKELHEYKGKVAIMATPCAIAGIRNIQRECPDYIKANIVFTIANFCGGFKSWRNIKRLAEIHQVDYYNLRDFRFRGGGQPGSLRFIDNDGKEASTPYPNYVGLNGYSKMHRCFVCPDASGELTDISCGDAWIPRFEKDDNPWSMIICRTEEASKLVEKMGDDGIMVLEQVSEEEVILSQRYNLASKKTRQKARMALYHKIGLAVPSFDGGYCDEMTSMKTECQVTFKHLLTWVTEKCGLYMRLYGHRKLKKK